jgi:transposase
MPTSETSAPGLHRQDETSLQPPSLKSTTQRKRRTKLLQKKKRQIMVVMEGTGGYEYLLVKHLACHKIEAAVINPRRIGDFAKGIGMDAKTDRIDAQVISKYAEVVVPKPIATKSDHELKHGAWVARRNQLLELSTTSAVHVDHCRHASQPGH